MASKAAASTAGHWAAYAASVASSRSSFSKCRSSAPPSTPPMRVDGGGSGGARPPGTTPGPRPGRRRRGRPPRRRRGGSDPRRASAGRVLAAHAGGVAAEEVRPALERVRDPRVRRAAGVWPCSRRRPPGSSRARTRSALLPQVDEEAQRHGPLEVVGDLARVAAVDLGDRPERELGAHDGRGVRSRSSVASEVRSRRETTSDTVAGTGPPFDAPSRADSMRKKGLPPARSRHRSRDRLPGGRATQVGRPLRVEAGQVQGDRVLRRGPPVSPVARGSGASAG